MAHGVAGLAFAQESLAFGAVVSELLEAREAEHLIRYVVTQNPSDMYQKA